MTIKVKLRQKSTSGNRQSLYLDFYPAILNPKTDELTRREFLGLYLFDKAKTPFDKQHNKEIQEIAEHIRQKKDNQFNKPEIYTGYEKEQLKIIEKGEHSFLEYFKKLASKRKGSNRESWLAAFKYLEKFTNGKLKFINLNETFCSDFREYLLTVPSYKSKKQNALLSQNTASTYFSFFKTTLKQAYKDDYLLKDLNAKVESIKLEETQKSILTLEELNVLAKTECNLPILKKAALFSALTGLRYIDIENLVWGKIEYIKGQGYFIDIKQIKTGGVEVLPISDQTFKLLGKRKGPTDKVFDGLYYSAWVNKQLTKWIKKAKITKDITFHRFRHTYAVLQLELGTDIFTLSKMLGHRELKTTQVYAKVRDKAKRQASDKIKLTL